MTVPESQLVRIGDRSVLVIDRFDRRGTARIGYASAMTMLEARDGDQRSYLEIAEVIEEGSPAATADLRQLWQRMAFSILISNTDDHLRARFNDQKECSLARDSSVTSPPAAM